MKERNIKVIIAEPMRQARICTIENNLEEFQDIVDGLIDTLIFTEEDDVIIILNDEGKINCLPFNRALANENGIWDIVAGTMIIAGDDYINGEFVSLTDEQAEKYLNKFLDPEIHFMINGEVIASTFKDPMIDLENFSEFTTEGRRRKYDRLLKSDNIIY